MDLLTVKIIAMVLMGSLALFFGLLPLKVKSMILKGEEHTRKRRRRERIISGLLCFGSGVLIATVFIHMLPETREGFQRAAKLKNRSSPMEGGHTAAGHRGHIHEERENMIANQKGRRIPLEHVHGDHDPEEHGHEDHEHHPHESHDHGHSDHKHDQPEHIEHDHLKHSEHDHSKLSEHDHPKHSEQDHPEHGEPDHPGHSEHDHTGHSEHDHPEHSEHDHTGHREHDHTGHSEHDHPEHSEHDHTGHREHDHTGHREHDHTGHSEHDHPEHSDVSHYHVDHSLPENNKSHNHLSNKPKTSASIRMLVGSEVDTLNAMDLSTSHDQMETESHSSDSLSPSLPYTEENPDKMDNLKVPENLRMNNSQPMSDHAHEDQIHKHEDIHALRDEKPAHTDEEIHEHNHEGQSHVHEEDHDHSQGKGTAESRKHIPQEGNKETHELAHDEILLHEKANIHSHSHGQGEDHELSHSGVHVHPGSDFEENKPEDTLVTSYRNTEYPQATGTDLTIETDPKVNEILNANQTLPLLEHPKFEALVHNHDIDVTYEESHAHDHSTDHAHEHSEDDHHHHGYPLAELVICLGFFLIYIIEEVMHKILFHSPDESSEKKNLLHQATHGDVEEGNSHCHTHTHLPSPHRAHAHNGDGELSTLSKTVSMNGKSKGMSPRSEWGVQGVDNPVFAGDIDATSWNPNYRNSISASRNQVTPMASSDALRSYGTASALGTPTHSPKENKSSQPRFVSNLRSLLIVIALSFHGVFEGMAVGLQENQEDVWYLFLAISAHKFVIAFCIGLELLVVATPMLLFVLYMLVLALVTPCGVGVGIIITESVGLGGANHHYIITILQGIAGGTLLYVAFLEVLERERNKKGGRLIKLFCLALGFTVMASLEAIGGGHSHGPVE